jgi:hypothetical protein
MLSRELLLDGFEIRFESITQRLLVTGGDQA